MVAMRMNRTKVLLSVFLLLAGGVASAGVRYVKGLPASEGEKQASYVKDGNALVVTSISSQEDLAGLAAFMEEKEIPIHMAEKEPFKNKGLNADRTISLARYPEMVWEAASLQGFFNLPGAASKVWEVAARRYDNKNAMILHRSGKGVVVLLAGELDRKGKYAVALEKNLDFSLKLQELGLSFLSLSHDYTSHKGRGPELRTGSGNTLLRLRNISGTNVSVVARLELEAGGEGRSRFGEGSRNDNGDFTCYIQNVIDLYGPCTGHLTVTDVKTGKFLRVAEFNLRLTDYLEAVPPRYRGMVSTDRRQSDVRVWVQLNAWKEPIDGRPWTLKVTDSAGKVLCEKEGAFTHGLRRAEVLLPIAADAPAGRYGLEATTKRLDGRTVVAKSSFEIVPVRPGQMMIDQDGHYLLEGKPFFPLGVYHAHASDWETPIDDTGLRAADMGFNFTQMWGWDWNMNLTVGGREKLRPYFPKMTDEELDQRLAENQKRRELFKRIGVKICIEGWGFWNDCINGPDRITGLYNFEKNKERIQKEIRDLASQPDHLVAMWYLGDEVHSPRGLDRAAAIIHEADKDHPVFNLGASGTGAAWYGDGWGVDRYPRYGAGHGSPVTIGDLLDEHRAELGPSWGVLAVPQAFGQNPRQPYETPEFVRAEAYVSLVHGANGILFYCWQQTGDWDGKQRQGMGWNPPTAHMVRSVIAEIKVFYDALFVPGAIPVKSKNGEIHGYLCGDEKTGVFFLAVNVGNDETKSEITLGPFAGKTFEPLFDSPKVSVRKNTIKVKLPGLGRGVWRVK